MSPNYMKRLGFLLKNYKQMNSFMNCGVQEFRVISADDKKFRTEFEVTEEMVNPLNVLHGGCTATLLDVGCSAAAFIRGTTVLSLDVNVSYLSPAKLGETVLMDVELVKHGKSTVFTRGELLRKRDGAVVAMGRYTFSRAHNVQKSSQATAFIDHLLKL